MNSSVQNYFVVNHILNPRYQVQLQRFFKIQSSKWDPSWVLAHQPYRPHVHNQDRHDKGILMIKQIRECILPTFLVMKNYGEESISSYGSREYIYGGFMLVYDAKVIQKQRRDLIICTSLSLPSSNNFSDLMNLITMASIYYHL